MTSRVHAHHYHVPPLSGVGSRSTMQVAAVQNVCGSDRICLPALWTGGRVGAGRTYVRRWYRLSSADGGLRGLNNTWRAAGARSCHALSCLSVCLYVSRGGGVVAEGQLRTLWNGGSSSLRPWRTRDHASETALRPTVLLVRDKCKQTVGILAVSLAIVIPQTRSRGGWFSNMQQSAKVIKPTFRRIPSGY